MEKHTNLLRLSWLLASSLPLQQQGNRKVEMDRDQDDEQKKSPANQHTSFSLAQRDIMISMT